MRACVGSANRLTAGRSVDPSMHPSVRLCWGLVSHHRRRHLHWANRCGLDSDIFGQINVAALIPDERAREAECARLQVVYFEQIAWNLLIDTTCTAESSF